VRDKQNLTSRFADGEYLKYKEAIDAIEIDVENEDVMKR